ncbi:MAG: TolC family protein [Candidatus Azobacteroides sp.]|nr:TolC family protein [Candidatus Azobacteroides sp.]
MKLKINRNIRAFLFICVVFTLQIQAQGRETLSLEQVIDSAYRNNHLLKAAEWQVKEKEGKVAEIKVKALPIVLLSGTYLYNHNIGKLTVEEGALGTYSLGTFNFQVPYEDTKIAIGNHHLITGGAFLYQPLSQQFKIRTGVEAARADTEVSRKELEKARQQIKLGVEELYYAILINRKQIEEAELRVELAKVELYDVESALIAGEAIQPDKAGLQAELADKEKDLLKLRIDGLNYWSNMQQLTGLVDEVDFVYPDVPDYSLLSLEEYKRAAKVNNVDIRILDKEEQYALLGKKATQQGYIPDVGVFAGYSYIHGTDLFSNNTSVVGVNFSWNLQNLLTNKQSVRQLDAKIHQVTEKRMDTELQVNSQIENAYRNMDYSRELIGVALREVKYRMEDLQVKEERWLTGLNTPREVVEAQADLAKATSDLYAAQLGYVLAYNQLTLLSQGR